MPTPTIQRFVLFCDEAFTADSGLRYHHYFGGLLIPEQGVDRLERTLKAAAPTNGEEMKWQKVDALRLDSYCNFMTVFFNEVAKGFVRGRVMFLDKLFRRDDLTPDQHSTGFQRLYYTFIFRGFRMALLRILTRRNSLASDFHGSTARQARKK